MTQWWEALTLLERVLACIAIPATLLLVIQLVLTLIGLGGHEADADGDHDFDGDHDLDADHDFDGDHDLDMDHDLDHDFDDPDHDWSHDGHDHMDHDHGDAGHGFSLHLFSFRGITAFFAVCGWASLAISRAGHPWLAALLIGLALGAAAMVLVAVVMALFVSLQADGTVDIGNAVGLSGRVYLSVPALRGGEGKVSVVVQETLTECGAVTDEEQALPTGTEVTVVGVTRAGQLIVMKK